MSKWGQIIIKHWVNKLREHKPQVYKLNHGMTSALYVIYNKSLTQTLIMSSALASTCSTTNIR